MIIPLIFWLRKSLKETEVFERRRTHHTPGEIFAMVGKNWRAVGIGMMLSILTTTTFYLITAYTPTFGREALKLTALDSMLVTLCVGASNFIWLPIGGALSDRFGRRGLLYAVPVACILTAYPVMDWLVEGPSFVKLLAVGLYFSMFFGLYNGAMVPRLAEIVEPRVRTAAFALAFSLATAIFGGFTPAISTYLIHATGNRAAPALWLSLAAAMSLIGVALSRGRGLSTRQSLEPEVAAAE
jgi:nitrate/nitrite transporter NarK